MAKDLSSKLVCPKCYEIGYLVKDRGKYLRVAHNYKKINKRKTRFCYIGTPVNAINKFKKILKIHPKLAKDIDFMYSLRKIAKEMKKEKPDPMIAESLLMLRKFSKNLGEWRTSEEFKSRRLSKCPHCGRKVAIWTKRTGSPPPYSYKDIWLEKYPRY